MLPSALQYPWPLKKVPGGTAITRPAPRTALAFVMFQNIIPFQHGFQDYFFAALRDIFPCRNNLNLILYSEIFISCAVVTVPGKAV